MEARVNSGLIGFIQVGVVKLTRARYHTPMKHLICNTVVCVLLVIASGAYGDVPSMNVTVSDASAKGAFKGATSPNGTFATGKLKPGKYVVQFDSKSTAVNGNQYLLVVSAGKKKVIADAVAGEKLSSGGVAIKVDVAPGLKITGQVVSEEAVVSVGSPKVRVINGTRYFWVESELGSNLGGHWVEEGLPAARNIVLLSPAWLQKVRDHGDQ